MRAVSYEAVLTPADAPKFDLDSYIANYTGTARSTQPDTSPPC
jgi:hypothetical protein